MNNTFERFESPLTEEKLVETLDALEPGSPEARELIGRYADQCHEEADREAAADPENPQASNRANIKAEMKIGLACLKSSRYAESARDSLWQTLEMAIQDENTADLALEIRKVLGDI